MSADRIGNSFQAGHTVARPFTRVLSVIAVAYGGGTVNAITGVFRGTVNAIASVFRGIVNAITSVFQGTVNAITSVFQGTVNAITSVFQGTVNAITSVFRGTVNAITSVFRGIVNAITSVFRGTVNAIASVFRGTVKVITSVFRGTVKVITSVFRGTVNAITSVFRGIVNAITSVFRGIVNAITSVFRGIVNAITSVFRGTVNAITSVFRGTVNAITSVFRGTVNAITSVFRGTVNAITSVFRGTVNAITSVFRGTVNAITSVFRGTVNAITSVFRGTVNAITSVFRGTVNAITSVFRGTVNVITSASRSIVTAIASAFRGIVKAITSVFRGTVNAITSEFTVIIGALAKMLRRVGFAVRVIVRTVVQGVYRPFQQLRKGLDRLAFMLRPATLTLSVENDVVRAVAFKGRDVIAWTAASLNGSSGHEETGPPPSEEACEAPAGDAVQLRRLLKEMPRGRSRVVTDMPMYAPLIRQLHLPTVSGRYRQQMILSEVLETIPFEPEEVDVTWQLRKDLEGTEAFAIAVPKGHVDSQLRIVKEASLSPSAAYTKATALAFAIGIPNAIVVHLEQDRVATVLVNESTPQVVHQQEIPWATTNPQEQADALAAAVDQVAGYYQARSPGSESEPLPVVLTGELAGGESLLPNLPQVLGRRILPFTPTVGCPDDFPQDAFAANLGLFLADQARAKRWGDSDGAIGPALDVLPQRYRPKPLPVLPMGVFGTLLLLVGLAIVITGPVNNKVSDADQLSLQRDQAQGEENAQLETQVARLGEQRELEEAQLQALGMESGLDQLQLNLDSLVNGLMVITEGTSRFEVELSGVAPDEGGFALAGIADSYNEVFAYADDLRASDLIEEASILQLTGSNEGTVAFSIRASVPQPADDEEEEEEQS